MGKSYKEIMPEITTFIFDVDGVLTNGMLHISETGELTRQMNIKDGYALKTAVSKGYHVCVISGGNNEGVKKRLEELGIKDIHLGTRKKIEKYQTFINKYKLKPHQILYMGDDIPDYPVMKLVGLPTCPLDAAPEIQNISSYISQKKGGLGCVRDVIEQVLRVRGDWNESFEAN